MRTLYGVYNIIYIHIYIYNIKYFLKMNKIIIGLKDRQIMTITFFWVKYSFKLQYTMQWYHCL